MDKHIMELWYDISFPKRRLLGGDEQKPPRASRHGVACSNIGACRFMQQLLRSTFLLRSVSPRLLLPLVRIG